jgi:Na+/H+-dicarboxylate symporter
MKLETRNSKPETPRRPWYRPSLTTQILIGLVLGGVLGYISPKWGNNVYFLRDIFLNLIKSIIAPLIFSTLVVGIAGGGDLKKVGRMGAKAILYFEIVTTIALFIGLGIVNLTKPGAGVALVGGGDIKSLIQIQPQGFRDLLVHIFPASVIDSMVRGDVLQIVAFSVLFAMAVSAMGEKAAPILRGCDALSQVMFKFTNYVMMFAPVGVGAAMAHTIATNGLAVLWNLGKLIGSLYLALFVLVVFVFGAVMIITRVPIKQFLKAVREPFTIAFATTSSESALPKAMENMERLGVPRRIVGFVMPTGYSFNLDGTTLYLAMASVFVAQAAEPVIGHMNFGRQIVMMLTLMITSKGVAGVPRAALVILLATLNSFMPNGLGPIGVAVIFGVDELMDMGRTSVNVLGNCLATIVVARWEGEFDDQKARVFGTPEEVRTELAAGKLALADAAAEG